MENTSIDELRSALDALGAGFPSVKKVKEINTLLKTVLQDTKTRKRVGVNIRLLMAWKNMSIKEVGKAANIDASHVSRILGGTIFPSFNVLTGIAQQLDTEALFLLKEDLAQEIEKMVKSRRQKNK